ncbi:MAG: hypothetical protein U0520_04755 [Candidatus Saccharimonadales bacterium]
MGSHTVVELLNKGHEVVIVDNLVTNSEAVLERIENHRALRLFLSSLILLILRICEMCFMSISSKL